MDGQDFIAQGAGLLPGIIGGALDYARQCQQGVKRPSLIGAAIHVGTAGFFGYLCLHAALWRDYGPDACGIANGAGGWLGAKVGDVGIAYAQKKLGVQLYRDQKTGDETTS